MRVRICQLAARVASVYLLVGIAPAAFAAQPSAQADVAAGSQVFHICQACHSLDPGRNLIGPSLAGVVGRKAGTAPGFDYSEAMKSANITWDAKSLDAYLADPQKVVPGNRMPFGGLKSDLDRQELVAYLEVAAKPGASASTLAAAGLAALALAAVLYGRITPGGKDAPVDPACLSTAQTAKRLRPLVHGEIAALALDP